MKTYRFEDIRRFFAYRPYSVISECERRGLMDRTLTLNRSRAKYLRAFIDGYILGKTGFPNRRCSNGS